MKLSLLILSIILIFGCAEKTIDSSSDDSFKKSIESIESSLTEEEKEDFKRAIQAIAFSETGDIFRFTANPEGMGQTFKRKLHRKTAKKIIKKGNLIIVERKAQILHKTEEFQKELLNLKNTEAKANEDKEQLKTFQVLRSKFYYEEIHKRELPIIEITLRNNTGHPVSRVYFQCVLSTPGHSVPWVNGSFNYETRGGIEPGEEATWKIDFATYSEWAKAPKDRQDMVLTVTVPRIDGRDYKPIFNSKFSKRDKARLKALTKLIDELKTILAS